MESVFSVRLGTSKTMDNYSEPMDTISIMADSDEEAKNGYSWIEYFVTAEKISNKQVAFAIYTLYFPAYGGKHRFEEYNREK